MINIDKQPGQRIIELGGGANRHPAADVNVDVRAVAGVDFQVNFEEPNWPIQTNEFDGVISIFCLEHCSYRKVPIFLSESFRIIKPGGWAVFITPNTESQLKWIQENQDGWDGRSPFDSFSCVLFGDQDYDANAHKSFWSPLLANKLFVEAGFVNVITRPFGSRETDLLIEAKKPLPQVLVTPTQNAPNAPETAQMVKVDPVPTQPFQTPVAPVKTPAEIYNRKYFENYQGGGFIWDFPTNELIARKLISTYSPDSVLELGCGRGYILKRLQDRGLRVQGMDVSKHAWMTRVCDPINTHDLLLTPWPLGKQEFNFCFSHQLLEHIPEQNLESFVDELKRVSKRGVHAVTFHGSQAQATNDSTRCTLRSKEWWRKVLPETHEIVDPSELIGDGTLPKDYVEGDGKIKLNLGCAWSQYYQGWTNIDVIDAIGFAQAFGYKFLRHDINQGLPYATGVADAIQLHHVLEHFSYAEGLKLLRECRRVIRADGAMRIVVPDSGSLCGWYAENDYIKMKEFGEMNEGCQNASSQAQRLWSILGEGHKSFYDIETLQQLLKESGWKSFVCAFRTNGFMNPEPESVKQILRETIEYDYGGLSLFVNALPSVG